MLYLRHWQRKKLRYRFAPVNYASDYFIEITTRQALVKEITIDGNGYWKCSSNEIPKEISPRTSKKIKIRQISKEGKNEPCTIRLEVDGYERWVLDIVFPET